MSGMTLDGAVLEVVPVQHWDGRSIEVRGLLPATSYDTIQLFFESKQRSGGDAVEHMQLDGDNRVAYVTFESSEGQSSTLTLVHKFIERRSANAPNWPLFCYVGIMVNMSPLLILMLILERSR